MRKTKEIGPFGLALRCAVKTGLIPLDKEDGRYLDSESSNVFYGFWAMYEAEFSKCFLFKKPRNKLGYVPPALDSDTDDEEQEILEEFKHEIKTPASPISCLLPFVLGFLFGLLAQHFLMLL